MSSAELADDGGGAAGAGAGGGGGPDGGADGGEHHAAEGNGRATPAGNGGGGVEIEMATASPQAETKSGTPADERSVDAKEYKQVKRKLREAKAKLTSLAENAPADEREDVRKQVQVLTRQYEALKAQRASTSADTSLTANDEDDEPEKRKAAGGDGHSHSHGHGHSHGERPVRDSARESNEEWNYMNVFIAVWCSVSVALLVGLAIYWGTITTGPLRKYYIGIEEVEWSYTPDGNQCGAAFNASYSDFATANARDRIGSTYRKARYVQYTDETFTNKISRDAEADAHLGLLGPLLRATVGETIRLYVRNDASLPFSINPWGLRVAKNSEGSGYDGGESDYFNKYDDAIAPLALHQATCNGFGINMVSE